MRRVMPLELVGLKKLDYNLYDENGELIYTKGESITPEFLMALNFRKIYKLDEDFSLDFSEIKALDKTHPQNQITIVSEKIAVESLNLARSGMKQAYEGKVISRINCVKASHLIYNEVVKKINKISCISELRIHDDYLFSHSVNVTTLSIALGIAIDLTEEELKELAVAAFLHDIGKMKIPLEILNKPGILAPDEFNIIKDHSLYGYEMVLEMGESEKVAKVALEHQERNNGEGYPFKLKGDDISLFGQIVAVTDVYDALVSDRVYKKAVDSSDALRIMMAEGDKSFDPKILNSFVYFVVVQNSKQNIGRID